MEHKEQGTTEIIDIEEYIKEGKNIPSGKTYQIRIDKQKYIVNSESLTGRELLELAGKEPINKWAIYEKLRGGEAKKIDYDEIASFLKPGIERFKTMPLQVIDGI